MRIKNTTQWRDNDLRRLFGRCIQIVREVEGEGKSSGLEIKVGRRKNYDAISGGAITGGNYILIRIRNNVDLSKQSRKERLAHIFTHEFYHTLGYKYHDYKNYKRDFTKRFDYSWVEEYEIREKV